MYARPLLQSLRAVVPLVSLLVAASTLGCSGESNSGDGDDDSGGTSSGGTSSGGTSSGGTAGSGTGGSSGSPVDCHTEVIIDPTALIDDMEDDNPLIATVADRNGSWWVTGDGTEGATLTPPSGAAPPPERILGMRCGSELGMRVTGQGFTAWGANLSIGFKYEGMEMPIDASDFSGVMFWARIGETHNADVRVQFQDTNTYPNGGVCNPDPASGTEQCYDGWGTSLTPIDTTWHLYRIDFSRMAQRDFGAGGDALDTTALYGMEWVMPQDTVFDLWIDDVWFYE